MTHQLEHKDCSWTRHVTIHCFPSFHILMCFLHILIYFLYLKFTALRIPTLHFLGHVLLLENNLGDPREVMCHMHIDQLLILYILIINSLYPQTVYLSTKVPQMFNHTFLIPFLKRDQIHSTLGFREQTCFHTTGDFRVTLFPPVHKNDLQIAPII